MNLEKMKESKTYKSILALSHEQTALLATSLLSSMSVALQVKDAAPQGNRLALDLSDSLTTLQGVLRSVGLTIDSRELC